jgi:hypothetical protein
MKSTLHNCELHTKVSVDLEDDHDYGNTAPPHGIRRSALRWKPIIWLNKTQVEYPASESAHDARKQTRLCPM